MQRRTAVNIIQTIGLLANLTFTLQAVEPLDIWQWRNPLPQGNPLSAITYAKGLLVAVGDYATILTSPDLATSSWARSPVGTNTLNLNAITCGNGLFVAGGAPGDKSGLILTSTDATNWYNQTWTKANTRAIYGLAYGAGLFVAACERAEIWTSPNGTNWTLRIPGAGSSASANGITYHPTFGFVVVGNSGRVLTSQDGVIWGTNTPTTITLNSIVYGHGTNSLDDGIFVVAGSSGLILTSPDGTNWTGQFSTTTAKLKSISYGKDTNFVAVGSLSSVAYTATSPDGTNWTSGVSSAASEDLRGVTYALGKYTAVGHYGATQSSPSGDPTSWVSHLSGGGDYNNAGTWGAGNFVVVGTQGAILTSPNGITWTSRNRPATIALRGVGYGLGLFVAVGDLGTIETSTDNGTNWSVQSSPLANGLKGVACGANTLVVVGDSGVVFTSPDGTNWTSQVSATSSTLRGVAYNGTNFVAVGDAGTAVTSPDGTNWTAQTSGRTYALNSVTYGANNFVVAGDRNVVLSSPDGTNWTLRTTQGGSSSPGLSGVAYGSGNFVVAGGSATLLSSPDGATWISRRDCTSVSQRFIVYGADNFVVGGSGGILIQASAIVPSILFSYASGSLTLTWSGGGTLLAAPEAVGLYTNVPGASSPYTVPSLSDPSQLFFRVRLP